MVRTLRINGQPIDLHQLTDAVSNALARPVLYPGHPDTAAHREERARVERDSREEAESDRGCTINLSDLAGIREMLGWAAEHAREDRAYSVRLFLVAHPQFRRGIRPRVTDREREREIRRLIAVCAKAAGDPLHDKGTDMLLAAVAAHTEAQPSDLDDAIQDVLDSAAEDGKGHAVLSWGKLNRLRAAFGGVK
jgi:hypothetical protein